LQAAKDLGATASINSSSENVLERIHELTGGRGVDVAMEAVGIPATFELCQKIISPGARIANIGVHGTKVDLHLEELWIKNISITTG
ncbi:alcohol dehydrogenase, partial [Staphylococcus pseudintermedius]